MKNSFSNFVRTEDNEQLLFTTNFDHNKKIENLLVFNYGLVCSNHHWSEQIKFFDELGYNILLHDYRGHYQSTGIHDIEKITFNQMANDLHLIINSLKVDSYTLLGHSMGVNVTLEYAKLFPEKINKLILISGTVVPLHNIMMDTHLTGPVKPLILDLLRKFPKEFELFWKYGGWNPIVKKVIHTGGFNVEQVSDEFIEIYLNKLGQLGPELFFQLINQMHDHDILGHLNKITSKTLVIGGNRDKVIPNYLQRLMHERLSNSELYVIHEGSHVPQVDFYELANERMLEFIQS